VTAEASLARARAVRSFLRRAASRAAAACLAVLCAFGGWMTIRVGACTVAGCRSGTGGVAASGLDPGDSSAARQR
jgi:hypothetical protein